MQIIVDSIMKNASAKPKRLPGRPATGKTKEKISVTVDCGVWAEVLKEEKRTGLSRSQIVEACLKRAILKQHTIPFGKD